VPAQGSSRRVASRTREKNEEAWKTVFMSGNINGYFCSGKSFALRREKYCQPAST